MLVTVSQLNNYLKGVVDTDSTLSNIEVSGEITGAKLSHGYWFFGIKDDYAQLDCFAFGDKFETVTNGMQAIVRGSVNFLTKSGKLSLTVSNIVEVSEGQSYLQYIQLKNKLDKLGLFDIARKKSLPYMPSKIGVVTSKTGAVIKDICEVVLRRQSFTDVVLCPVKVQGEGAVLDIVRGIRYMSTTDIDVLIVARGGGSNEDLAVFNDEQVVVAIADCSVPTISAIGHGVDYTLCDMVADVRAVTPTEAGELATIDSSRIVSEIALLLEEMGTMLLHKTDYARQQIVGATKSILALYNNRIELARLGVISQLSSMANGIDRSLDGATSNVQLLASKISSNNPERLHKLGYYTVFSNGKLIKTDSDVVVGSDIQIIMEGGSVVHATVTKVDEK